MHSSWKVFGRSDGFDLPLLRRRGLLRSRGRRKLCPGVPAVPREAHRRRAPPVPCPPAQPRRAAAEAAAIAVDRRRRRQDLVGRRRVRRRSCTRRCCVGMSGCRGRSTRSSPLFASDTSGRSRLCDPSTERRHRGLAPASLPPPSSSPPPPALPLPSPPPSPPDGSRPSPPPPCVFLHSAAPAPTNSSLRPPVPTSSGHSVVPLSSSKNPSMSTELFVALVWALIS